MKKLSSFLLILTLGLLVGLIQSSPAPAFALVSAVVAQQDPGTAPQAGAKEEAKTFTGTIAQSDGKYVLQATNTTYQLDDQDKAKQFDGKKVKVTGSLDSATNTIHVSSIEAATS